MKENLLDDESSKNNNELIDIDDKDEGLAGIKTISTNKSNKIDIKNSFNSDEEEDEKEDENLNINLTKKFSMKSKNSILS